MVVNGARKHLVQRQRMQHQQAFEMAATEQGHGGVAQGGDVSCPGLLQDQTGFANALTRPNFVVELQLAIRAAARAAELAVDVGVFASSNMAGGDQHNGALIERYRDRVASL